VPRHVGHDVTCVDLDADKVDAINARHLADPRGWARGAPGWCRRGSLPRDDGPGRRVAATEVTILAVGTPFGEDRIDLGQIVAAAEQIGTALADLDRYHVVVVKSTVVPGTTEEVVGPASSGVGRGSARTSGWP
jgi:UDPglucose 6-dehydrogenase